MGNEQTVELQAVPFDLGERNVGSFGPAEEDLPYMQDYVTDLAKPEYSKTATNEWICVDGRCSAKDLEEVADGSIPEMAKPQIAGSKVTTDVAAAMMNAPGTVKKRSELNAELTRQNIEDGQRIIVHGDTHKQEEGCKANAELRAVLHFNAANIDVIAPVVWAASQAGGLDRWVNQEDITTSIVNGKINADNDELWDITTKQAVEIQVANGAEYEELLGDHQELAERLDLTPDGAFAKAAFVRDHSQDGRERQAFAASVGRYAKVTFESAARRGISERDAALQVMRAIAYNVGISKMLKNDLMPVAAVTPVA